MKRFPAALAFKLLGSLVSGNVADLTDGAAVAEPVGGVIGRVRILFKDILK